METRPESPIPGERTFDISACGIPASRTVWRAGGGGRTSGRKRRSQEHRASPGRLGSVPAGHSWAHVRLLDRRSGGWRSARGLRHQRESERPARRVSPSPAAVERDACEPQGRLQVSSERASSLNLSHGTCGRLLPLLTPVDLMDSSLRCRCLRVCARTRADGSRDHAWPDQINLHGRPCTFARERASPPLARRFRKNTPSRSSRHPPRASAARESLATLREGDLPMRE